MLSKIAAWFSTAALASLVFAGAARAADAPACRFVKIGELPVTFARNRPMVQVSIDGKPGWFLVDTGSSTTLMWGGAAASYGLRPSTREHMKFYGVGGGQDANFAIVREFQLGDAKAKDLKMFVIGRGGSAEFAGVLGRDFLGHWDLEFDLANKVLRLWTPLNCGSRSLAYWTKTPELADLDHGETADEFRIKVEINGKPFEATLDSGAAVSVVTPEVARRAGVREKDYTDKVEYTTGIGERPVKTLTATFDKVVVGDEQILRPQLKVSDMFAGDTTLSTGSILQKRVEDLHEPGILLGADFLRSHRVMVAASQGRLYFTYNGGPVFEVIGGPVRPSEPDAAPPPESAPPSPGK